MVRPGRRGASLFEVILVLIVVGIALTPALVTINRQVQQTRWTAERLMAIQLANDLLEYYDARGFDWLHLQLGRPPGMALRHWSISGYNPLNAPSIFNPVLGGPTAGPPSPACFQSADLTNNAERTFREVYRFRRRLEIWGGQGNPVPIRPFVLFGNAWPQLPVNTGCYTLRVTITTDTTGTMYAPGSAYQVVSLLGQGW